eukprot:976341-Pyramimonas_sp.AAC.2
MTAVLPGSGSVNPVHILERTLHSVMMLSGAVMNAFVFGNVANLVQNLDQVTEPPSRALYN